MKWAEVATGLLRTADWYWGLRRLEIGLRARSTLRGFMKSCCCRGWCLWRGRWLG